MTIVSNYIYSISNDAKINNFKVKLLLVIACNCLKNK